MVAKNVAKPAAKVNRATGRATNGNGNGRVAKAVVAKNITVKVATLPGVAKDVVLDTKDNTLARAIQVFGVDPTRAKDVRVNNEPVSAIEGVLLLDGDIVTVVGQVNGG